MGRYRHLSIEEREEIMHMLRERRPLSEIARAIGSDKSTIYRAIAARELDTPELWGTAWA